MHIKKDNTSENARQILHTYNVGNKVIVTMEELDKYSTTPHTGTYKIMKVVITEPLGSKWVQL